MHQNKYNILWLLTFSAFASDTDDDADDAQDAHDHIRSYYDVDPSLITSS